jgi:nucleotide-binding universal stress UspA family protein
MILPLSAPAGDDSGLHRALGVAERLGAHVEGVFVRPDPTEAFAYTGMAPADFDWATKEIRDRVDSHGRAAAVEARARFRAACDARDIPFRDTPWRQRHASAGWRDATGEARFVVPAIARNCDLAVFTGTAPHHGALFETTLEATLLRSGRPVLYLPDASSTPGFERPLIAWDGGAACARAVTAWLDSGLAGDAATVLHMADPQEEPLCLGDVARHLSWHGIESEAEVRPAPDGPRGRDLLAAAADHGCGLIVMGGYGHLRYREALFGGITRHVIRQSTVPVLLVH